MIEKSVSDLQEYLIKKSKELSNLGKALGILERQLNRRQLPLIQHALKHPAAKYTIADQMDLHDVSYLTARSDLESLARMSFLKKTKDGVRSVFVVPENLKDRLERRGSGLTAL